MDCNAWFERSSSGEQRTRTACDDLHLNQPFERLEIRHHFFTVRVIEHWNKLPYSTGIRASTPVKQFITAVSKTSGETVGSQRLNHIEDISEMPETTTTSFLIMSIGRAAEDYPTTTSIPSM